jgi:signal transduction histidine kinase
MRILIAEDDAVSLKLLQRTLERWGFETVVCRDGRDALGVLSSPDAPQLVILDWMMPEVDGPEVCRQVRLSDSAQPKYIILLTAKAQRDDIIAGLQAGADDYVTKPFDSRELRARVDVGMRIVELRQQLSEKVDALEDALARLRQFHQDQKLEAIGRLAAGVAHEINTPIQFIGDNIHFMKEMWDSLNKPIQMLSGLPSTLRSGANPDELAAKIEHLVQESEIDYAVREVPVAINQSLEGISRVGKIVRAMRDFSHPGNEQKVATDLNQAIDTVITVARNEWKYVAEIVTNFDPNLPLVLCLHGELQQALLNIIINAAQAIREVVGHSLKRGTITVTTTTGRDCVQIRIADTGSGIPVEMHDRIFEPFFTTKDVGKGTGQGLSISRSVIVQQHGGKLWVESAPGAGSTFIIELPIDPTILGTESENHELKSTTCR